MKVRGELARAVSTAELSDWRVGGAAKLVFAPADANDLATFLAGLAHRRAAARARWRIAHGGARWRLRWRGHQPARACRRAPRGWGKSPVCRSRRKLRPGRPLRGGEFVRRPELALWRARRNGGIAGDQCRRRVTPAVGSRRRGAHRRSAWSHPSARAGEFRRRAGPCRIAAPCRRDHHRRVAA